MDVERIESFKTSASLHVKTAFVAALRKIFEKPLSGFERFTYVEEFSGSALEDRKSQIKIYRAYPVSFTFFPILVVNLASIDYSLRYLGQEIYEEKYDEHGNFAGIIYAAPLSLNIAIDIYTKGEEERESLTDYICFCFRTKFMMEKLAEFGIMYKDITVGREAVEIINRENIFRNTITISCKTEYELFLTPEFIENLKGIKLEIIS
jgi:hypothetical protein